MRVTFFTMGTAVSLTAPTGILPEVERAVRARFAELDDRFSLYVPTSEGSMVANREITLRQASAEYQEMYDLAFQWHMDTEGAFTPHRPDGKIDLSGVVKAKAIEAATAELDGIDSWCINAGGDVLTRGDNAGKPWVAGIVDPRHRDRLISQFTCTEAMPAVCTSGISERGEHIWRTGSEEFIQATVAAPDVVTADVLATAIIAGGSAAVDRALHTWPVEILAWKADGGAVATSAFRA